MMSASNLISNRFDPIAIQHTAELVRGDVTAAVRVSAPSRLIWPGEDIFELLLTTSTLVSRATITTVIDPADAAIVRGPAPSGGVDIAEMLSRLNGRPPGPDMPTCRVRGAFFSSILLYKGWWNKDEGGAAAWGSAPEAVASRTPFQNIQNWLNRGFEQWGPSLDMTPQSQADADLFAQIGFGDEANSLPVIVGARKAQRARDALLNKLTIHAEVTGALCHRDQVATHFTGRTQAIATSLAAANPQYDYFLVVIEDNPDHGIEPGTSSLDLYSAYLWQCLIRREDEDRARRGLLSLRDAIFVWEHTNLADAESVKFNLDSLDYKKEYLERVVGGRLSVLHSSYAVDHFIGRGAVNPLLPAEAMFEMLTRTRGSLAPAP